MAGLFGEGKFSRLFTTAPAAPTYLWPRFLFLRALGLWFFSAFYSLYFQIDGLIGDRGLLPAGDYLAAVGSEVSGIKRLWAAPTFLWLSHSHAALQTLVGVGLAASALLVLNFWPRATLLVSELCFLSFIGAAQDFASYQSDGMLLSAGFVSLFFAPGGLFPGLGARTPPSWLSLWGLRWLWFCVYFESGVVKLQSHDIQWRTLTAMDHYYENGPLPSFLGWWVQERLPHFFHAATTAATLVLELGLCWLLFLPRRFKQLLFVTVTAFQIGIILTANYAFLNYLILSLGILLVDDQFLHLPPPRPEQVAAAPLLRTIEAVALSAYFYITVALMVLPAIDFLPEAPIRWLEPFRIANRYGLFAVMTENRYEIEFQGSNDGESWTPYPFRYKPQALNAPPGLYAPYQPRFEWNLWFASLGNWRQYPWVVTCEERLLEGSPSVLSLFARDPFEGEPPRRVRAVRWQYWFTTPEEKARSGDYWRREERGLYAPMLERGEGGRVRAVEE